MAKIGAVNSRIHAVRWPTSALMKRCREPEQLMAQVESTGSAEVALSVILPVYNAMPWLSISVRDMLKQQLDDGQVLELVVAVDGCTDDSLPFLRELAAALGPSRATVEECPPPLFAANGPAAPESKTEDGRSAPTADGLHASGSTSLNPALYQPLRAPATSDHPSFAAGHVARGNAAASVAGNASATTAATAAPTAPASLSITEHHSANITDDNSSPEAPLTAGAVAAACRLEHRLIVLFYRHNCGQGAAMSLALSRCRAPLIAQVPTAAASRSRCTVLATLCARAWLGRGRSVLP
jgi:glycosyltransferase involved in cell wall biosynthesis